MHLINYICDEAPPELSIWIDDLVTATKGLKKQTYEKNLQLHKSLEEAVGLTGCGAFDTKMVLFMCLARICSKTKTGVLFWNKTTIDDNCSPTKSFELATLVGLSLDYWYDDDSLGVVQAFMSSNCRPSATATNHLIKWKAESLLQLRPDLAVAFARPEGYNRKSDKSELPDPLQPLQIFDSTGSSYSSDNLSKSSYVFMQHVFKTTSLLYFGVQQEYILKFCIPHDGEKVTVDDRAGQISTYKRNTRWKLMSFLGSEVLRALNEYGILLPYAVTSVFHKKNRRRLWRKTHLKSSYSRTCDKSPSMKRETAQLPGTCLKETQTFRRPGEDCSWLSAQTPGRLLPVANQLTTCPSVEPILLAWLV